MCQMICSTTLLINIVWGGRGERKCTWNGEIHQISHPCNFDVTVPLILSRNVCTAGLLLFSGKKYIEPSKRIFMLGDTCVGYFSFLFTKLYPKYPTFHITQIHWITFLTKPCNSLLSELSDGGTKNDAALFSILR